jgi:hypothetical protein
VKKSGFDRQKLAVQLGWQGGPLDPNDIVIERETLGWHRFIAHETTVVPTAVYFEGVRGTDREGATLVVEVKGSSLEPEPLRYPPPDGPRDERSRDERAMEMFPERRDQPISEDEFAHKLDEFVFIPFRVVVRPD